MFVKVSPILLSILLMTSVLVHAEEPDWSDYRVVLNHVKPGSKNSVQLMLVDYPAIKANGSLDKASIERWPLSIPSDCPDAKNAWHFISIPTTSWP